MEKIIVTGGNPLRGTVQISGSKNSALPIIAATLLTSEPCVIRGVPNLSDIQFMCDILRRSEEHTSELQSRLHLVCRLLLEKKKKNNNNVIRCTYRYI